MDNPALREPDEQTLARVDSDLDRTLGAEDWPEQLKLALACRKLAAEGHCATLAGQVTMRADDGTFWTAPLKPGFANVTQASVVRIDRDLTVVQGDEIPNPGVRFHLWVYEARPDVQAIVHTHPPHASALSMTGQPLEVAHMDAAMFFDDCGHLTDWPGVPVANEEGRLISGALGDKRAVLLANHGFLTVGKTLEEAAYLGVMFENAARMQILARTLGAIQPIRPEMAREAHDFLLKDAIVAGTFNSWGHEILRKEPDVRT